MIGTAQYRAFALLDDCAFHDVTEFPHNVLHRGFRFQVQRGVVVLDGPDPFGIYVCSDDYGGIHVLVGQGIDFTDRNSFKDLMTLVREFFRERVRRGRGEQDEDHGAACDSFIS
jgi:hypothetical protein